MREAVRLILGRPAGEIEPDDLADEGEVARLRYYGSGSSPDGRGAAYVVPPRGTPGKSVEAAIGLPGPAVVVVPAQTYRPWAQRLMAAAGALCFADVEAHGVAAGAGIMLAGLRVDVYRFADACRELGAVVVPFDPDEETADEDADAGGAS